MLSHLSRPHKLQHQFFMPIRMAPAHPSAASDDHYSCIMCECLVYM